MRRKSPYIYLFLALSINLIWVIYLIFWQDINSSKPLFWSMIIIVIISCYLLWLLLDIKYISKLFKEKLIRLGREDPLKLDKYLKSKEKIAERRNKIQKIEMITIYGLSICVILFTLSIIFLWINGTTINLQFITTIIGLISIIAARNFSIHVNEPLQLVQLKTIRSEVNRINKRSRKYS
ncbi:MAG: hypothetical protein JSW00_04585 [Thermoplasmata archaeon]|nr:MAG: hypothetical protein JSW00_04585 [Thermoplasmata archaeon]